MPIRTILARYNQHSHSHNAPQAAGGSLFQRPHATLLQREVRRRPRQRKQFQQHTNRKKQQHSLQNGPDRARPWPTSPTTHPQPSHTPAPEPLTNARCVQHSAKGCSSRRQQAAAALHGECGPNSQPLAWATSASTQCAASTTAPRTTAAHTCLV